MLGTEHAYTFYNYKNLNNILMKQLLLKGTVFVRYNTMNPFKNSQKQWILYRRHISFYYEQCGVYRV